MNQESNQLARAASQLAEEIEAGHKAVMAVYGQADAAEYTSTRMEFWKFAARLMGVQTGAVRCLRGLRGKGEHHTFTYIHQGKPQRLQHPPTPKKLKTNVPAAPELGESGHAEATQRP
jgi:hypothetical protein